MRRPTSLEKQIRDVRWGVISFRDFQFSESVEGWKVCDSWAYGNLGITENVKRGSVAAFRSLWGGWAETPQFGV